MNVVEVADKAKWGPRLACGASWPADEMGRDLEAVIDAVIAERNSRWDPIE